MKFLVLHIVVIDHVEKFIRIVHSLTSYKFTCCLQSWSLCIQNVFLNTWLRKARVEHEMLSKNFEFTECLCIWLQSV